MICKYVPLDVLMYTAHTNVFVRLFSHWAWIENNVNDTNVMKTFGLESSLNGAAVI